MYYSRWKPYVSVAERRHKAAKEMQKLGKKGRAVSPVVIAGRTIASTFWGKAWCDNLERYSDFSNRLPRGRTYVRNGSVLDLQIAPGEVKALVSGSEIYKVAVKVSTVAMAHWTAICTDCAGGIDSLVELLQGRFSKGVMERICREKTGLFPAPGEITFTCSCPDWASMCKHVAAVFYGIGARLDDRPELLFHLRKVDEKDLIAKAGSGLPLSKKGPGADKVLAADDLAEMFGLEMAGAEADAASASAPARVKAPGKANAKVKMKVKTKVKAPVITKAKQPAPAATGRSAARPKRTVAIPSKRVSRAATSAVKSDKAEKTPGRAKKKPGRPPKKVTLPAVRPAGP